MTGANKDEDPAPKGCKGNGGSTDEATNEEDGRSGGQTCEVNRMVEVKGKDEDTDEEIYEVDCIVDVKWAIHKHGVEKGTKPDHFFGTRWKGCGERIFN